MKGALLSNYVLPWPPSVNSMWRAIGRGRLILSKAGREYRVAVNALVGKQCAIEGAIWLDIRLYPPDRRKRDVDNSLKALLDAMQHAGIYIDDSQIEGLCIIKCQVANRVDVGVYRSLGCGTMSLFPGEQRMGPQVTI